MQSLNNEQQAKQLVKQVRRTGDGVVLWITITIIIGAVLISLFDGDIVSFLISLAVVLAVLGFSLFVVKLQQLTFMGNALRVQNGRHKYLKDITDQISHDLCMPQVDVFISQDPFLNAFAFGYMRPYTIVLHSGAVEELSEKEIRVILVHEMAHIKLNHVKVSAYILPISALVPIIGPIVGWIFGFWNRRAELAADRMAVAYTRQPHEVVSALTKIHVGSKFAADMGEEGIAFQQKISHGLMKLLAQSMNTHPFLTTRGYEAIRFAQKIGLQV